MEECPVPRHGDRPDCWFDGEPCDEHKDDAWYEANRRRLARRTEAK